MSVLLDTGLHLLDSLRARLPGNVDDLKDRVRDTYDTASDRVSRATDALRGEEDSHILGKVGALLIGVGIGVGIGVLIAPSSGEETRADITDKVSATKSVSALGKNRRTQLGLTANKNGCLTKGYPVSIRKRWHKKAEPPWVRLEALRFRAELRVTRS